MIRSYHIFSGVASYGARALPRLPTISFIVHFG